MQEWSVHSAVSGKSYDVAGPVKIYIKSKLEKFGHEKQSKLSQKVTSEMSTQAWEGVVSRDVCILTLLLTNSPAVLCSY